LLILRTALSALLLSYKLPFIITFSPIENLYVGVGVGGIGVGSGLTSVVLNFNPPEFFTVVKSLSTKKASSGLIAFGAVTQEPFEFLIQP
jgi:hypothetical protein